MTSQQQFQKFAYILTYIVQVGCLGVLSFFTPVFAQGNALNKEELEKERATYQKKIALAMRSLETNSHTQKESMSKLEGLNYQLSLQKGLVENIRNESLIYDEQVKDLNSAIERKQKELKELNDEYAKIVQAYQRKDENWDKSLLALYFSSTSMSEFLSRKEYFRQFSQARKKEIENLQRNNKILQRQQQALLKAKQEKDNLLQEQLLQEQAFEQTKATYNTTLANLKQNAKSLQKEIEYSKNAITAIDRMVYEQIKKHENKNTDLNKTTLTKHKTPIEVEPEQHSTTKPISITNEPIETKNNPLFPLDEATKGIKKEGTIVYSSFDRAKGFLALPVLQGFITRKFGIYQHPANPRVVLENHGVDIRAEKGATVVAVFGGKVIAVNRVPGAGILVMVQHSKDYYTIYAKLESAHVKIGHQVSLSEQIGIVGTNSDGVPEVQFQIWKGLTRLNPEEWLTK